MRFSLGNKIALISVISVALFAPILFYYFPSRQEEQLKSSFEQEIKAVGKTVAMGMRIALKDHDYEAIETAVQYAKSDKRLAFISLMRIDSLQQRNVMSVFPENFSFAPDIRISEDTIVEREFIPGDEVNMEIVLGFKTDSIRSTIRESRNTIMVLAAVVSVLTLAVSFFIARLISKRIHSLTESTKKIAGGDLSIRARSTSNDELSILASSFNKMIEKIEISTSQLNKQKEQLEKNNLLITESIDYSRRLQSTLLSGLKELQSLMPGSSYFNRPKSIVSGDFLWLHENEQFFYVAVIDCTGHGVPGSMLSIVGHFLLERIIRLHKDFTPADILELLAVQVYRSLKQELSEVHDGMDVAMVRINKETREVVFSGAHRPLLCKKADGEVVEVKGTRRGIGGKNRTSATFQNHVLHLIPSELICIFTDGITDQFGSCGKKFGTAGIKRFLSESDGNETVEIGSKFENEVIKFMNLKPQMDDMSIVFVKL